MILSVIHFRIALSNANNITFLRCLLGYFMELNEDELPWQEVPLHSVIKLSPKAYGCQSELIKFDVPSVSTHRPKPDSPGQLDKRFVYI